MPGLTVRWCLAAAPDGVEEELARYVASTSHARFTGKPGLRFKTWRMRPCEIVAVAEGGAGFLASPSY